MVAKFLQPDSTTQTGTAYKGNIDASVAVVAELAAQFAVCAQDTPNMTVVVRAGRVLMPDNIFLTYTGGNSPTLTAPTTNDKVVFICFRLDTGAIALVDGAESPTPAWPLPPVNYLPLANVYLTPTTTQITNSIITALPWYNISLHHLLNRSNVWNASQTVRPAGDTNTEHSIQKQGAHLFIERSALDSGGEVHDDWKVAGGNSDYDTRQSRLTGANGDWVLLNRGTGSIRLRPNNGAAETVWDSTARQTAGIVPLARMQRTYVEASSANLLVQANLGTVNNGDIIIFEYYGTFSVGGSGTGLVSLPMTKSGTATIVHLGNSGTPDITKTVDTSTPGGYSIRGTFVFRVTATGTLTLGPTSSSITNISITHGPSRVAGLVINNG